MTSTVLNEPSEDRRRRPSRPFPLSGALCSGIDVEQANTLIGKVFEPTAALGVKLTYLSPVRFRMAEANDRLTFSLLLCEGQFIAKTINSIPARRVHAEAGAGESMKSVDS